MSNKPPIASVFTSLRCGRNSIVAWLAVAFFANVFAQGLTDLDPDWKELQFKPPANIAKDKMLPLAMPPHLTLKFAVDTSSISVGTDRVVRYVIVASSANASNAIYEGIRCKNSRIQDLRPNGQQR